MKYYCRKKLIALKETLDIFIFDKYEIEMFNRFYKYFFHGRILIGSHKHLGRNKQREVGEGSYIVRAKIA